MDATELQDRFDAFERDVPVRTVESGGMRWTYRAVGAGERTLLAIPGAAVDSDIFFVLMQELEADRRVIGVDVPAAPTFAELVDGIVAVLDAESVSRATVVGGSFGGFIGQALVRQHPDRVADLILSNTAVPVPAKARTNERAMKVMRFVPMSLLRGLLRLVVRFTVRRREGWKFWRGYLRRALGGLDRDLLMARYAASVDLFRNYRWGPDDLMSWDGHVLIIESDDDKVANARARAALRDLYPDATVHVFEGAGHGAYVANPLGYTEIVRRFLDRRRSEALGSAAAPQRPAQGRRQEQDHGEHEDPNPAG